jgi:predicted ABC-class ATPase
VLQRSAVVVRPEHGYMEARVGVHLPARGRSIMGRKASDLLTRELLAIVIHAMSWSSMEEAAVYTHVECVENQEHMRSELEKRSLVSFVANGVFHSFIHSMRDHSLFILKLIEPIASRRFNLAT